MTRSRRTMIPIVDWHADTPRLLAWGLDLRKRHRPLPRWLDIARHVDLPRLEAGGVAVMGWGMWTSPVEGPKSVLSIETQIAAAEQAVAGNPDKLVFVRTGEDARNALAQGRIGVFLGVEGAHALDRRFSLVASWRRRGVRYLTLAHLGNNIAVSSSCPGARRKGRPGLAPEGYALIEAAESAGVLVDLAHVERQGFLDAARASRRPVVVTHTGVSGVFPHWRNIDDDQLRAVAATGGVVGVINTARFLGHAGIEAMVRHLLHIVRVAGRETPAFGSDFDGMVRPLEGLEDPSRWPNVIEALERSGMTPTDIEAVAFRNSLRVLDA